MKKKYQLKNNIKNLEDISINLFKSVDELKIILEKIEKNKEETKINNVIIIVLYQNEFSKLNMKINKINFKNGKGMINLNLSIS